MFLRRSIEILTFVLYWFLLVPLLYDVALEYQLIVHDLNNVKLMLSRYVIAIAIAVLVYMIMYRISVWIYIKCKKTDIKMYNSMKSLTMNIDELERQAKEIRDQQNKHELSKQAKTNKLEQYIKWLPNRRSTQKAIEEQSVAIAPPAASVQTTPAAQRKKLSANRIAPPPPSLLPLRDSSTLPRANVSVSTNRQSGIATMLRTTLSLHHVPAMVTSCALDGKPRTPALNARIAALQASVNSTPILKKKSMSNPAFVNGDWV